MYKIEYNKTDEIELVDENNPEFERSIRTEIVKTVISSKETWRVGIESPIFKK